MISMDFVMTNKAIYPNYFSKKSLTTSMGRTWHP